MTRPDPRSRHVAPERSADAAGILRLSGEIDMADCRQLDHRLRTGAERLVVDLSEVTLLSAAAIGVLIAHSERLSAAGGGLFVVAGTPQIRRLLQLTRADEVLDSYDSLSDSIAACASSADVDGAGQQDLQLGETAALRRRLRTQPMIARALGMLQERYGLPDGDAAFALLRESSQRHNLRLHRVAAAVLGAPPPRRTSAELWFPGRVRRPAPDLTFAPGSVTSDGNRSAVLDALLKAVSACVDTTAADLQLADAPGNRLRLARHRGLTAEVVELIGHEEYAATAPGAAHRSRQRVVADVETDPIFTDPAVRIVLLSGGSLALQSSPLPTASGRSMGVVSTHHSRRGRVPTPAEHTRLDDMTRQIGTWLEWYQRTVVLDALEHVHRSARTFPRPGQDGPSRR